MHQKCLDRFLSKIREYWIDVRLRIAKLESEGQHLPFTKENLPEIFLTLKNAFFLKVLIYGFYPFQRICSIVTHLHDSSREP